MFNNISYNVVVERFKVFADGHFLIRRFTHGQVDQTDLDKDQLFPWMHVAPVEVRAAAGARVFTFDVIFADIPRDKEDKTDYQKESISDCIRLAEDLLSEIQNGQVVFSSLVEVDGESTITPFIEEWTHTLTGCTLALTISVPNNYSACDIPADWSIGGGGGATPPSPLPSLVLRVNNVDNAVQNVLDLVNGANVTVEDLGDGRVRINSSGGGGGSVAWGAITGTLSNQTDLQTALNLKADISSLGAAAFSNDYNDLSNLPTIPVNLNDLDDVETTGVTNGQVLTYNTVTALWEAETPATSGTVNSVGLSMPNAFTVSGSPVTSSGTLTVTAVGTNSQYITGAGEIANFPATTVAWGDITGTLSDQTDLQNALDAKMTTTVYDTDIDGVVDASETVQITVRNSTGSTLLKGQIVYLSGATGNRPNAVLADASTEATSSKTIGFVIADIADNADGQVAVSGTLHTLDTSSFTAGDTLWLSETAGAWQANTPPAEPAHAVFLGYISRSHPTLGRVIIAIQNGYELNELHGVQVPSPSANDLLYYDGGTDLWQSRQLTASHITDSTTVGQNLVKLANPSAIRYLRVNADNTVTAISAATLKTELGLLRGAQTSNLTSAVTGTNVNITGCVLALDANSTYIGRLVVSSGFVSTTGFNLLFTFPSGSTMNIGQISSTSTSGQFMQWQAVTSGTALTNRLNQAATQIGLTTIEIFISTGANSGNLTPAFVTTANGNTATVYGNATFIQLEKI